MHLARNLLASLALGAALGACATSAPYEARAEGAAVGYSEQRLSEGRWRVEYRGGESTTQETVETYLLYRAAELTAASGYEWFTPADQTTDAESELVIEAVQPRQSPVWRPLWRERGRFWWTDWMPRGPAASDRPQAPAAQSRFVERYAARAEIDMGRGAAPEDAFDARDVMAQLAPAVRRSR